MLKHIPFLLTVCLLCGMVSCSNNDEVPVQENVPVQVGFTLTTGGAYGSRALPGEDGTTTDGTGFENYIDIANRDFRLYIFDADSKFVTELKVLMVMPTDDSEYPSTYYVLGELGVMPPETFKVVVIANWPNYPASTNLVEGQTTIEDICEASEYDYVQPFVPSASQKIPMYGVRTYTDKTFKPNLSTELDEIYMLRAMAKVEVKLADGLTDYTLESAKVTNFSGYGMAAPINIYDETNENCTAWETMHIDHADVINTGSTSFPISNDDSNSRIIYLPEYKNVDVDYPSYITVTLNGKEYDIYFRNYVEGKPTNERINIVRNHHYVFTIKQVGASIEVVYTVADWIHVEDDHYWKQEYSYPTYENVIPWTFITNGTDHQAAITTAPTMYYVANNWETNDKGQQVLVNNGPYEGAFEVAFKMTGPDDQKWTPAIHGSETDCGLRVYRNDDQGLTLLENENDWVSSDKWYKIQLIPKKPDNVGHEFELGITTTLTIINQTMYLLINGEDAQTIRWPNSGSDARIIRVKQVSASSSSIDNENNG